MSSQPPASCSDSSATNRTGPDPPRKRAKASSSGRKNKFSLRLAPLTGVRTVSLPKVKHSGVVIPPATPATHSQGFLGEISTPQDQPIRPKGTRELTLDLENQRARQTPLPASFKNPFLTATGTTPSTAPYSEGNTVTSRLHSTFDIISKRAGSGAFGVIHIVKKKLDGCTYCVKQLRSKITGTAVLNEVWALAAVAQKVPPPKGSEYIVKYFDSWVEHSELFIQTEYCADGDLYTRFVSMGERMPAEKLALVWKQMARALAALHFLGISHLDVSPRNILQHGSSHTSYRLCDFGRAVKINSRSKIQDPQEGDPKYLCPRFAQAMTRVDYLDKVDVYALAASITELASGIPLDPAVHPPPVSEHLPLAPVHRKLLLDMLHLDPNQRPTAAEVVKRLAI